MIARIDPFSALEGLSRRRFLVGSGAILSATAVALMAGRPALAAAQASKQDDTESDVRILNTALSAELEAIAAYAVGAGSGLLQKPALDLALQFQGHHKEHADALAKTVRKLGGTPAEARERYVFPTDKLKSQADVLGFAAGLERGEAIYARCQACHALAYNRTGPKHCGLFGRRAGGVADFRYSPAMAHASIVWNGNTLDRFPDQPDCDDSGHDYGLRRHCRCAGTGGPDRLVAPGKCILCRMHAVSHP